MTWYVQLVILYKVESTTLSTLVKNGSMYAVKDIFSEYFTVSNRIITIMMMC